MNTLTAELDRYLTIRRSLGYRLDTAERILRRFVTFMDSRGATLITADLFLQWKAAFGKANRNTWAARLSVVRLFAQWLQGINPRHEMPAKGLIPFRRTRGQPHIFSEADVGRILAEAEKLPSVNGIRGLTYSTLFGLIAVTGLRISEALDLDDDDVDLVNGVLTIRNGKSGKQRLVPLSPSVRSRLEEYARERDRLLGHRPQSFFVSDRGDRTGDCGARYNFAMISQRIGLRALPKHRYHGHGPRIHDLRHTFAVRTMIAWYRQDLDLEREMPKLSTYLGHTDPSHTYWYIEAVPELMSLAAERAAKRLEKECQS
jgi:integrase